MERERWKGIFNFYKKIAPCLPCFPLPTLSAKLHTAHIYFSSFTRFYYNTGGPRTIKHTNIFLFKYIWYVVLVIDNALHLINRDLNLLWFSLISFTKIIVFIRKLSIAISRLFRLRLDTRAQNVDPRKSRFLGDFRIKNGIYVSSQHCLFFSENPIKISSIVPEIRSNEQKDRLHYDIYYRVKNYIHLKIVIFILIMAILISQTDSSISF